MRTLFAFTKKEFTEQLRCGRLMILICLFIIFGIMNPAIAKITPWLLTTMADSLAESGMIVSDIKVSAMDSWVQFYKNIPICLIIFVLLESSIFTKEYTSGTLILSLTKGLERYKVIISKSFVLTSLWTVGYWLCFVITYGYNEYFWDNSTAKDLVFSAVCWYLFGMAVVALTVLFSILAKSNTGVLLGTGGTVISFYLIGLLSRKSNYFPTYLTRGNDLIYGLAETTDYTPSLVTTVTVKIICYTVSITLFNKKQL